LLPYIDGLETLQDSTRAFTGTFASRQWAYGWHMRQDAAQVQGDADHRFHLESLGRLRFVMASVYAPPAAIGMAMSGRRALSISGYDILARRDVIYILRQLDIDYGPFQRRIIAGEKSPFDNHM
jgi:hypothetical protein